MRNPTNLTHADLADIVSAIQDWMYLDVVDDEDTYNPEKEWSGGDVAMYVGELLAEYGLVSASYGDEPETPVPPSPARVVIVVHGGLVQDIFCSDVTAEAVIVDWDTEGSGEEDPGIVEIVDGHERHHHAAVIPHPVTELRAIEGSDTLAALRQAEVADRIMSGWHTEVVEYVLFDFDAKDLATTNVYKDRAEAVDDASQLDNAIVLPLVLETITCPAGRREE